MTEVPIGYIDGLAIKLYRSLDQSVTDITENYLNGAAAVAINPEKILLSRKYPKARSILLSNDVRFADGIGVVKLLSFRSNEAVTRIPGCELWEALMSKSGEDNIPVFLVGATSNVVNRTKIKLKTDFNLDVVGVSDGFFNSADDLISEIKKSKAKIVTVAMGSPKQEEFISRCRDAEISAFFIGVGGTYDVFTGNVKRAPRYFLDHNLEWFYRLITQPSRIVRQLGLVKFVALALLRKI